MTGEDVSGRVHVVVTLQCRPEAVERLLAAFSPVIAATRAEAACVRYELCRSVEDACRFVLVEEWRDQAGLDAHLQLPHVQALLGAMPGLLAAAPTSQVLAARS